MAPLLGRLLPIAARPRRLAAAVLRGLAMGVGVTLLFALWPLLEIRRVPPALILRREVEPTCAAGARGSALVPIAAGLAGLALWQAGSWKIGGLFLGGLAGALLLLGARRAARRCALAPARPRWRSLAWRQGAGQPPPAGQPGAGAVLVSLGLAVMLIVAVALLESSLRDAARHEGRTESAPAFFFIDVQTDQAPGLRAARGRRAAARAPELIPVVRVAPRGDRRRAAVPRTRARAPSNPWYLTREYVLTWAAAPPGRNSIVAGRWWTPEEAAREPLISVEEELAKQLEVGIGGTLTFDVLGVPVTARVVEPAPRGLAELRRRTSS